MQDDRPAVPVLAGATGAPPRPRWQYFAAAWALLGVFFIVLAFCAAFFDRFPGDEAITDLLQRSDVAGLGGFLAFVNVLGDDWFFVALVMGCVVGLGLMRAGWESLLAVYVFLPRALNAVIKEWIGRPRPSGDLVEVSDSASGFGYPSGHAVGTSALFLVLFFVLPAVVRHRPLRLLLQAGCVLLLLAAGPARVYVGVHWPSDAFAGYLLALLLLAPPLSVYLSRRRFDADPTR